MAPASRVFLGVDGGQSSTRAAIGDAEGRVLGRAEGGPCVHPTSYEAKATFASTMESLLRAALASAGLSRATKFEGACFGLSGAFEAAHAIVAGLTRCAAIRHVTDADAAIEGAAAGGPGVVVIAGTGSMALARDARSNAARCGGWGYVFGDDGSAFDIVRRALRKSLAGEEGWGERTVLGDIFLDATGSKTVNDAMHGLYFPEWTRNRIAGLAVEVDRVACQGDLCAQAIMEQAGDTLGSLAAHAVRGLPTGARSMTAFPLGGVFKSCRVLDAFAARIRAEGLDLGRPRHDAAIGALRLAYGSLGIETTVQESS